MLPLYASLDVVSGATGPRGRQPALASAGPIATLPVSVASSNFSGAQGASPAYSLLNLGEVVMPPVASQSTELQVRLWFSAATANPGLVATGLLDIGGLYLQPLDGGAGVLPRGIMQPTWSVSYATTGRLLLSAVTGDALITSPTSVIGSIAPLAAAGEHYRGVLPLVGASTIQLDLNVAGKENDTGSPTGQPPVRSEPHFAQVSLRYRPRFAFVRGI